MNRYENSSNNQMEDMMKMSYWSKINNLRLKNK